LHQAVPRESSSPGAFGVRSRTAFRLPKLIERALPTDRSLKMTGSTQEYLLITLAHATGAVVLIVEDDETSATELQSNLVSLGYRVSGVARSAERALQSLVTRVPDLILMDIELAGDMDGIDAAKEIHSEWSIPVVFLTASGDSDTIRRASQAEPYSYLIKPCHERDLRAAIEIARYRHRMERERAELVVKVEQSEAEIERLRNLLPICAWCGQIRGDDGQWMSADDYLANRLKANLTHGICGTCQHEMDPGLN
jgi:two-component system, response regulator PdtaR